MMAAEDQKFLLWMLLLLRFAFLCKAAESSDVTALLAFRDGLTSDPGRLIASSWDASKVDSTGCPWQWYGVVCSNGVVNSLLLNDLALVGKISFGTIGKLLSLSSLVLANNSLRGELPSDLGNLSALRLLDFSNNEFSGSLPESLANLRSLTNVSLAGNKLQGSLPDQIFANLTRLLDLDLSRNSFAGRLPSSSSSLQKLVSLNLSWNDLAGVLSSDLRSLESLQKLDLHQNRLSGTLDPSLMGLADLEFIDVSCNNFSGRLPWQQDDPMIFPQHIAYVNLSFNQFSGELAPENAASLFVSKLETLDLSNNLLSGKLPSFNYAFAIKVLRLQNNEFSGSVPSALLAEASVLKELDMSSNKLSGPVEIVRAIGLSTLKLSSNQLSGPLPIRLGSCAVVDLSNNDFSGNLSVMSSWGDDLQKLDLSFNSLSGVLPNETRHLLRLMHLNISHNTLEGSIPSFYASFHKLSALDFSFNSLEGEIPGEFFHSASLSILRLDNNRFIGGIPVMSFLSSSKLPGELLSPASTASASASPAILFSPLQILDLSSNRLNGSIPHEIASFTALETINLSKNDLTGSIPASLSFLRYLERLDLSFNHLSGRIPDHLPSSLQRLNLSNNDLSGAIPADLSSRFPLSAFFPGNVGLRSPANSASSPRSVSARRKGLSSAVKAGLIGGCIAATATIVAAGFFIYQRRNSRFQDVEKGFEQRDISRSPQDKPKFVAHQPPARLGTAVSLSGEQLLPGQETTPSVHTEGLELERSSPAGKRSQKLIQEERSSPSGKRSKKLIQEGPSSTSLHSPSFNSWSPERLAGDLFLLDDSVVFTPEELSSAPAEVLGRSSHGTSYKATLENGHVLTVKWLREGLAKNKKSFTREAKKIGSIQHPNIVPLRGYYWGPREHEKLVMTDYLSCGSLADRLSERSGRRFPPLDWSQRLGVANDAARGLSYLHTKHKLPHGNLKATNVLLDGTSSGLVGRLSDYSIHRLMTPEGTANQILNAGALGYRAPELANASQPKPTLKSDVYAFGVILMEIVTGKGAGDIISGNSGAVDLTDWVKLLVSEGRAADCYDQALVGYDRDQEPPRAIEEVLALALKCIISQRSERPSVRIVLEELSAAAAAGGGGGANLQ